VTQKFDATRLTSLLLKLRKTSNPAIIKQVVGIDADIETLDSEIAQAENDMNQLTYRLYKLTEEEIRLIEGG
jgi:seryl-tRNA synthetase